VGAFHRAGCLNDSHRVDDADSSSECGSGCRSIATVASLHPGHSTIGKDVPHSAMWLRRRGAGEGGSFVRSFINARCL
jgi:hypothetical protein